MKKRLLLLMAMIALLVISVRWMGFGYYSSDSAVRDLRAELIAIHGEPYTREVETGTETMEISIEPDTFFLTNYSLRHFFSWDYRYKCEVIYTVMDGEYFIRCRQIRYVGIDPMGTDRVDDRAYIDMSTAETQPSIA